jgi:hypothetical protein
MSLPNNAFVADGSGRSTSLTLIFTSPGSDPISLTACTDEATSRTTEGVTTALRPNPDAGILASHAASKVGIGEVRLADPMPDWLLSLRKETAVFAQLAPDELAQALVIRIRAPGSAGIVIAPSSSTSGEARHEWEHSIAVAIATGSAIAIWR